MIYHFRTNIMRIAVEVRISGREKKVYHFDRSDLNLVFVAYEHVHLPPRERNWRILEQWGKYARRNKIQEPQLTEKIRELAKKELFDRTKVFTWDEWKPKK